MASHDTAGILITFEGIEGSGKTTQLQILADHLALQRHRLLITREPGGTVIGDQIRKLLLNPNHKELQALPELLLYAAARAQHVAEKIRPALEMGKTVLCDRFCDATLAYQGAARGLPLPLIAQLNDLATSGVKPRLTFLFDCPVEIGLRRARERYQAKHGTAQAGDRLEQEEIAFHEHVREGYRKIAAAEPNRVIVIDATGDIDEIHQMILREIQRFV